MDVKSSLKRKLKVVFSVFEGCVCVCVYLSIDQSIDRYNGYEKLTDFFQNIFLYLLPILHVTLNKIKLDV